MLRIIQRKVNYTTVTGLRQRFGADRDLCCYVIDFVSRENVGVVRRRHRGDVVQCLIVMTGSNSGPRSDKCFTVFHADRRWAPLLAATEEMRSCQGTEFRFMIGRPAPADISEATPPPVV